MDLLVLKSGGDYIRVANHHYQRCKLNKASVFPISQRDSVARHLANLQAAGFEAPAVARLEIRETPYHFEVDP